MKYAVIILLSFVFGLFSCGSPQVDSRGSAHVVVEYEGQVVQETGAYYLSIHEFEARLNDKSINRHFIIFMHDSCSGCIKVKNAIKARGWHRHVSMLDLSERWVYEFAKGYGINAVPTMIAVEKGNPDLNIYSGPSQIMIYLSGKILWI